MERQMGETKCPHCHQKVSDRMCYTKSVINLKYHPNEYREKKFCSTNCVKVYIEENKKETKTSNVARVYNWGGGAM